LIPTSRIYADEAGGIPHDETPRVHIAARWPAWPLAEHAQQAAIGFLKAHRRTIRISLRRSAMGCVK
jgi:hypothetical protein